MRILVTAKQSLWGVDAPELVGAFGTRLRAHFGAFGLEAEVPGNQVAGFFHEAVAPLGRLACT